MGDLQSILEGKDPEDVLNNVLSESEKDTLHNIKYELGTCVKWGTLTENMFTAMLQSMDMLVFLENEKAEPRVVKRNPYEALFPKDQERLNGSHDKAAMFRRYILLHLLKKLLGSLKTYVNREIDGIEVIDEDTEMELKSLLGTGADEEEMDLVGTTSSGEGDREIVAKVSSAEDPDCRHNRLTMRQVWAGTSKSGLDELHKYCKECRRVIQVEVLGSKTKKSKRGWFFEPRECRHPRVRWQEGAEGKTAVCSVEECGQVIPNPETYRWVKVGLEPYGDDPSQDEVIRIPACKEEAAA